jgi:hypothetical protein
VPLLALAAPQDSPATGYKTWGTRLMQPQSMSQAFALSCGGPTAQQMAYMARSPHTKYFTQLYVNPVGKPAWLKYLNATQFPANPPLFPVGTVIVKEKLPKPDSTTPVLLTVMVKREKGYNPACYDWEFFVTDGTGKKITEKGKIARCQNCHVEEKRTNGIASLPRWTFPMKKN